MIQDIAPHKLDNQYHAERSPQPYDCVLSFRGQEVYCCTDGKRLQLPNVKDVADAKGDLIYLFSIDEKAFFLLPDISLRQQDEEPIVLYGEDQDSKSVVLFDSDQAKESAASSGKYHFQNVWRNRRGIEAPQEIMFAISTGKHLAHWYRTNRFCGCCGTRTEHDKKERALQCPKCGNRIYPKIAPAVIIGVTNGDELLVTKYGDRELPFYALVAGFVEIGETLEECVEREVLEEVGLKVKNIRYYKSQPWGIVDDLLAGFFCEVDGDPTVHLDHQELKEGIWAKRGDVPLQPDHFSLTGEMMRMFNEGKE